MDFGNYYLRYILNFNMSASYIIDYDLRGTNMKDGHVTETAILYRVVQKEVCAFKNLF
jgi:hypothetical protein